MAWTKEAVAGRIAEETSGLIGDNVEARRKAIVITWLSTLLRQELDEAATRVRALLPDLQAREEHDGGPTPAALINEVVDAIFAKIE